MIRRSIVQSFVFHAAHHLSWHSGRCAQVHGHTYRFEVVVVGELDENGIIIDFDSLVPLVHRVVLERLDHHDLNEIIENPTAELIAEWIFNQLEPAIQGLSEIRVWETSESAAIFSRS